MRHTPFGRLTALLLAAVLTLGPLAPMAAAAEEAREVTVLFTHDLHSHFLPAEDEEGEVYGGYARLYTMIAQRREVYPDALLVDGGDFSMGSLFQTAYATAALELRAMGAMGFDVTTFGNHEYDYGPQGFAQMLQAAVHSGDPLPALVESNYAPQAGRDSDDAAAQAVWEALDAYGVTPYTLIERGGQVFAVIGVMGEDSHACAPSSEMALGDRVDAVQKAVDQAVAQSRQEYGVEPVVVCLSHSGTDGQGGGEDVELARRVSGVHLIVSAHTHTTLTEPLVVGNTVVVSCGSYGRYLGEVRLRLEGDAVQVADYQLHPIGEDVAENADLEAWIQKAKTEVEENYLSRFDLGFDQVLADSSFALYGSSGRQEESTLGNLISDAYAWAAQEADGKRVDVAFTAAGVIRAPLAEGEITVSEVFDTTSLGIGADGVPGYPLISAYLTGKDLKTVLEVDASVTPLMREAQLYCSGVVYTFNPNRMFFNKVTDAALVGADGSLEEIADDKLYRVVTGMYCGQMIGAVNDVSMGLLSITLRDEAGNPIALDRLEECIVYDDQGNEVKEWHAIARYLQRMGGEMDGRYAQPQGRKTVSPSWNPVELLRSPNRFTIAAVAGGLAVAALAGVLVWRLIHWKRKRR